MPPDRLAGMRALRLCVASPPPYTERSRRNEGESNGLERAGRSPTDTNSEIREGAGGAEGIRTPDPHNAIVVLYQLSYDPSRKGSETVEMASFFVKRIIQPLTPM